MKKNQGWDDRRSVMLDRSKMLLDKSANNGKYSTNWKDRSFFDDKKSQSFVLPNTEKETSFRKELKKLKAHHTNLNQLLRKNSINKKSKKSKKSKS